MAAKLLNSDDLIDQINQQRAIKLNQDNRHPATKREDLKLDGAKPAPDFSEAGEFLAMLGAVTADFLEGEGVDKEKAVEASNRLLTRVSQTFAGEYLYFNKKPKTQLKWINAVLDLRYMHYRDVDKKYDWSPGYSLKVKEKLETRLFEARQMKLPFDQ